MGESDYLFYFTFIFDVCPILPGRSSLLSTWYLISHFTSFIAQQCFFHSLFRMGESDYPYDNPEYKNLSQTKRKILFFLFIFLKKEYDAWIFHTLFRIRFWLKFLFPVNPFLFHDVISLEETQVQYVQKKFSSSVTSVNRDRPRFCIILSPSWHQTWYEVELQVESVGSNNGLVSHYKWQLFNRPLCDAICLMTNGQLQTWYHISTHTEGMRFLSFLLVLKVCILSFDIFFRYFFLFVSSRT